MTVVTGSLDIQMPNATESNTYTAGESFDVEANSSFNVNVNVETAYLCIYG